MIRPFVFAWHFLTAIPLSRAHHEPTAQELGRSMGWFPFIGLMLGALLATGDLLLSRLFSRGVVDALLIVLLVFLTRGMHQDGLADSVDGLAGGRTSAERLAIMRDGRIGALGATGLILDLGLRYAELEALLQPERVPLLICMPAVGRWAMVVATVATPYARVEGGLAAPFSQSLTRHQVVWATLWVAAGLCWFVGPIGAVIGLGSLALVARGISALAHRYLGGITGDILGATNEVAELLFLLAGPMLLSLR